MTVASREDRAAAMARERGIYLLANTGYEFQDASTIAERVKSLYDHGVRMVLIQSTGALLQFFLQRVVKAARESVQEVD